VAHWREFGKGRCFHLILGHDARTIQNAGWQALMLRGTEWAATGKVTIPIPDALRGETR
jgi:type 1 glutamine amidotransferase